MDAIAYVVFGEMRKWRGNIARKAPLHDPAGLGQRGAVSQNLNQGPENLNYFGVSDFGGR